MYTLHDSIWRADALFGAREAVVCGDVRRTYAELATRVRRVAGLLEQCTEVGERVALLSLNSDRYLELFIGIPCAGRVIVPHNTRWADPELVYATEDAGARVLICDRDPGVLADSVERVIRVDTGEYDELLDAADEVVGSATPETLAGLFYTGGTTGASKGVMLTHANLMANAVHTQLGQPLVASDRYLTMAPMFHAAGIYAALVLPMIGAANVVVPSFEPNAVLDLIGTERVTCAIAVPTMLAAMNDAQAATPRDVSSLRWLSHGASPAATEVLRTAAELFGCELIHLYGATETSPLITIFRHEQLALDTERGKSCGQAAPGISVRIVAPDGVVLPTGDVGEVSVSGPNVMIGYWNKPEQTAEALSADGWYRTGDVGRLDDEGYLTLVDRAKDMIVTGGENVYCTEVEDVLFAHPAVSEATVFGIPDDQWGESVHAVVVLRDGIETTDAELIAHCRERIAGYKVPKSLTLQRDPLPKSGPGKVLKRVLREPFWEGREPRDQLSWQPNSPTELANRERRLAAATDGRHIRTVLEWDIAAPSSATPVTWRVRLVGTDANPRIGLLARPARAIAAPAMRVLFRSNIEGLEHVPATGPAIICANHRSFFDTPLLMAMGPRPVTFLGKAEYMDKPLTRYLFPALGMVPIKRNAARSSMAALETAADLLRAGELVGIYPEGTRSRDGFLHRGHTGVAHLAMMTGAPIVPVGLIGTERVQPIGTIVPRPFRGRVRVRFGAPLDPISYRAGGSRTRRRHLVDDVMASIAAMTNQQRSDDFASDEAPLIRGGSEAVYLVTTVRSAGLSWRHAAERAVAEVCGSFDDARVGEVRQLQCRIDAAGTFRFDIELALSTKFIGGTRLRQNDERTSATRAEGAA